MNEMERGLHGLKTRTNAELFYFKVRIHPFCPRSPRSFLFKIHSVTSHFLYRTHVKYFLLG